MKSGFTILASRHRLMLAVGEWPLPHLEGLFEASAWYDGSTSVAAVKEI
jgi:hypothetical protein